MTWETGICAQNMQQTACKLCVHCHCVQLQRHGATPLDGSDHRNPRVWFGPHLALNLLFTENDRIDS
jgi:aromatic ring-cleaving dioxygenase